MAQGEGTAAIRTGQEVLLLWVRRIEIAGAERAYVFSAGDPTFDAGVLARSEVTAIGSAAASLARSCGWRGPWEVRDEVTGRAVRRRGLVPS